MNKREIKHVTINNYFCEACDKKIIQDGKDVQFIYDDEHEMLFHFHRTCLIEHLKKTWIPNP